MHAFKQILIHDITPKSFADVYAQTIAYGMFAARLHDPTLPTFSRQEAAELIPRSNPFLRKLFGYIAGPDIDDRIKWIVDSLVEIFLACNVEEILKNYGKATKMEDPIIHFYETFLSEYDPKLRKARGVWYTPQPVVNFIVRAVDDILKTEFGLPNGLADNSKTKIKVNLQETDKRYKNNIKTVEEEVHRVQILDPATGTGTFLAEVVKQIHKRFEGQQGIWSNYVETHLLPRLNGFELLMASYAMAHLKLDLLLTETGYKPTTNQRFRVYLTNSLEEHHQDTGTLFANWLSTEANEANRIKRDTPVMCVIGNPPYSVSSSNKSEWIEKLVTDYKKDLNERNVQPLSDDYIKFIRFGQYFIDKNGSGILAFISNNSFLDGIIHRGMRKSLLESFDAVYILDLHGNSKKKEACLDGSIDQNVFDIMEGVSINIFIKRKNKTIDKKCEVFHFGLLGKRDFKYDFLNINRINNIDWKSLNKQEPNYFFINKNFDSQETYSSGFKVDELFTISSSGIKTHRDHFVIDFDKQQLAKKIETFFDDKYTKLQLTQLLDLADNRDWKIEDARSNNVFKEQYIHKICYRSFDMRFIYYDKRLIDFGRQNVMNNIICGSICFISFRQSRNNEQGTFWISNAIVGKDAISSLDTCSVFPLYLYKETKEPALYSLKERYPNLKAAIVGQIAEALKLTFTSEKETTPNSLAPIDILDYIYAVLHSPSYREKYKEFLKIDFPRVPYPKDIQAFWQLVQLGGELRQIHLLESPVVEKFTTKYPADGSNVVDKVKFTLNTHNETTGSVYINDQQYFADVPQAAWAFYIGGYQPAQKWLKDRKGRKLEFDDILHYQKIIVALTETGRIMKEIDKVGVE
jgi:predicted helicase